ncbi:MAG: hypothetical protein JO265_07795 [Acidimicrobiia bacterium]|nr:hypothetical protein [Acidimicrobiia bacterium]
MRRGLGAAAAGAVVALSFAPLFAAPARAQTSVTVTPSNFSMSPPPTAPLTTSAVSVSGHFHADGPVQPTFQWVSVNVVWNKGGQGPSQSYAYCGTPPNAPPAPQPPACPGNDFDFKQNFLPPLSYNGPYSVTATGQATDPVGGTNTGTTKPPIQFAMDVPPPNVTGVTAVVDSKTRDVTVSWDRDATTPDDQSYWIYRKGPGESQFVARYQVPQVKTGARVSMQPDTATAGAGGDYLYQVETHRNGFTGDSASYVVSDRTKSQSNKVTVPNPPPGVTTVPPPASNGPPPIVTGTPTGPTRGSGFSSSSGYSSSSAATTPTSEAVTPDPGFARGLPYAGSNPAPADQNGEGDNSAVAVTPGRHSTDTRGILVPVAGGAILFVGAFHLRMLKKRLDEPVGAA